MFIDKDGNKQFLGSRKRGCYIAIGSSDQNKKIFICEDYVTGAKIHEKTGMAVAVAFDHDNLEPVKEVLLSKYADHEIEVVTDNDIKEIAPSAGTNEAIDVSNQYNTDVCTPNSENSQEKYNSNDSTVEKKTIVSDIDSKPIEEEQKQQIPSGYVLNDSGLYKKSDNKDDFKISDKIEVLAEARDTESKNWSKVVRFQDHDNNTKTVLINNSTFITGGNELEEILASEGLYISKSKELRKYLNDYITSNRALAVDRIGWCNNVFVFPDSSTIGNNNEPIFFQGNNCLNEYKTNGTLEDWRDNVGRYCKGNSRLILAVGAAFAGTLLYITGQENGVIHFVGSSTIGKSTILNVACSVYGDRNFMKPWRATDNGLEGIAATRNDTLLVLDELGQLGDTGKAGEIAYMLGNGDGKIRSNRNGTAKKSNKWRCLFLSSGEKDLNDCAMENNKKIKAGQDIRFLSIPAKPTDNSFGAFETVHDKETGKAFSEYLNSAVNEYHGTAAREFIQCIINDGFEKIANNFRKFLHYAEQKYLPAEADNQVQRAMNRFMLIAFAGEYATEHDITGWNKDESLNACVTCFNDWIKERGGIKDHEPKALLEQVRLFFEQNYNSRFVYVNDYDVKNKIDKMAGFFEKEDEEYKYFVFRESLKNELCAGFNYDFAIKTLFNAGWIESIEPIQYSKRNVLRGKRVFIFTSKVWEDETVD